MKLLGCFSKGLVFLLFTSCSTDLLNDRQLAGGGIEENDDLTQSNWGIDRDKRSTNYSKKCVKGGLERSYPVYLTLDDGPHPVYTSKILDIANRKATPITFYQVGTPQLWNKGLKVWEQLNTKILENGRHQIANHTDSHPNLLNLDKDPKKNQEKVIQEFETATRRIPFLLEATKKTGMDCRFPYGAGAIKDRNGLTSTRMRETQSAAFEAGCDRLVHWNIDSIDWDIGRGYLSKTPSEQEAALRRLLDRIMTEICTYEGGVFLAHDVQPIIGENFEEIVDAIRNSGHDLVDDTKITQAVRYNRVKPIFRLDILMYP